MKRDPLEKTYYRIREVSELLDIPQSTLRFWETQFPSLRPYRNNNTTRYYTPEDIETLRMIRFLVKDRGLKIEAAAAEIKNNRKGIAKRSEAVERLRNVRDKLQDLLDSLNRIKR